MRDRLGPAIVVMIVALLQACTAGNDAASPDDHRTVGDSGSVVVLGAGEEEHAFPFASHHCAAYGKIAEFKSKGVKITRDLCDQFYGCRDFDVEDCNGYRLCFGQSL